MKIVWSDDALADLRDIHEYISREAPERANRFVSRLVKAVESLQQHPLVGRIVPEGDGSLRELFCGPYRLLYRDAERHLSIISVVHCARDLPSFLERRDLGPSSEDD